MNELEETVREALRKDVGSLHALFTLDITSHMNSLPVSCESLTDLHTAIRKPAVEHGYHWHVFFSGNRVFVTLYNSYYT